MGFIFLIFLSWTGFSSGKTAKDFIGLTKPIYQKTTKMGKSRNANRRDIVQNCYVYKNFAIVEVIDPGNKGAVDMRLRPRNPKHKPAGICVKDYKGKSIQLEQMGGYFAGVAESLIFVDDSDAFGGEMAFQVIDSKNGRELFRSIRNINEKVLIRAGKTIGIRYTKALQVDCSLLEEGKNCWKYILNANKIPDNNRIPMPDCAPAYEASGVTKDVRPQLAAWVRVKNLKKPEVTYLGGFIKCEPSP
ncbi:MAG: hypothetical protein ACK5V3_09130 [Bdellovibrionales bacterium]